MSSACRRIAAILCGLCMSVAARAAADIVVIASANSPLSRLTSDQAADIFLGKAASLPNVGKITPVDQVEGSAVRQEFYRKAANKTAAQLTAYWSRQIFTGKGEPPAAVGDTEAVKRIVASNPSAIGYIPKSAVDASVKPLLTIP